MSILKNEMLMRRAGFMQVVTKIRPIKNEKVPKMAYLSYFRAHLGMELTGIEPATS